MHARVIAAGTAGAECAEDGETLAEGSLLRTERVPVRGTDVGGVHKACPRNSSWIVSRPNDTNALFMTDDERARIQLINLHAPGRESAVLELPEQHRVLNISRAGIRTLNDAYSSSLRDYAMTTLAPALGVPLTLFSANTVINIHNGARGEDDARLRPDYDFLGPLRACGFTDDVVAVGENAFWCWNRDTGLWEEGALVNAAGVLRAYVSRDAVPDLEPPEAAYLKRCSGALNVVRSIHNELRRANFVQRLDSRLDVLPFANGAVELPSLAFRPLRRDDYVSRTTGYAFVPREDVPEESFAAVQDFYARVLPVPEEREVFLRAAGAALSGNIARDKFFIVATDKRDGGNGKSTLIQALHDTFGALAVPSQANFLYACAEAANAHGANDLHYRGRRLAIFDETNDDRPLNVEKMKRITGGGHSVTVRGAHERAPSEFRWTAAVFIACNDGRVPRFNASDSALMNRMVVVPFRAKFDDEAAAAGEEHAWPQDTSVDDRLLAARVAHMHVLLDALGRYRGAGARLAVGLPPGCVGWRADVAAGTDPRMEAMAAFVDTRVQFDVERRDDQRGRRVLGVVRRADLLNAFRAWLAGPEQMGTYGPDLLRGAKASELKALADAAMRARGRPLHQEVSMAGEKMRAVYKQCELS